MSKKSKAGPIMVSVVLTGVAIGAWGSREGWFSGEVAAALDGAVVRRGPLRISEMVRGNLKAKNSASVKSEIEGQSTILSLVEEGTFVKEGDLLVQLDVSKLRDNRVVQEISLQNALAASTKATEQYEIQVIQNESDIASAKQQLEFARLDLRKYLEGDWPQAQQEADESILLAEEKKARAEERLTWTRDLAQRGFVQRSELEADEFAFEGAKVEWEQAKRKKVLLVEYEHPRRVAELEADEVEKGRDLRRVERQALARLADFEAARESTRARLELEREKLQKINDQIGKGELRAPSEGIVVYGRKSSRWGGGEPVQEGGTIYERQEILSIPRPGGMIVEASLHETVLDRVEVGMPCAIEVDALPGQAFTGRVDFVAVVPDSNSWFSDPNQRLYRAEIVIDEHAPDMRPGMSCQVEILAGELDDVIHVPVQAVFQDAGETICFVRSGDSVDPVPVAVGADNAKWVEIKEGLEEGQTVLLVPPRGFVPSALEVSDEDAQASAEGGEPPAGRPSGASERRSGEARGARPGGRPEGRSGGRPREGSRE